MDGVWSRTFPFGQATRRTNSGLKKSGAPEDVAKIQVLIVNCDGEGTVKSGIIERLPFLANQGYGCVIGLLDLYPKARDAYQKYAEGLMLGFEASPLPVSFVLAVMELEAWFLNEATHYPRIHEALTEALISQRIGFNPLTDIAEDVIRHPAGTLSDIYALADLQYRKKEGEIKRTLAAIDFSELCVTVRDKSKSLDSLLSGLEAALD